MPITDFLLPEYDQEMANTRKMLAAVPDNRMDFKPHPKSFNMKDLAIHLATIPEWGADTVEKTELDFAPEGQPGYRPPDIKSSKELLETFDRGVAKARAAICRSHRSGVDAAVVAAANGKGDLHHAADCGAALFRHEPRDPSSRATRRVPADGRPACPRHVRPLRRRRRVGLPACPSARSAPSAALSRPAPVNTPSCRSYSASRRTAPPLPGPQFEMWEACDPL